MKVSERTIYFDWKKADQSLQNSIGWGTTVVRVVPLDWTNASISILHRDDASISKSSIKSGRSPFLQFVQREYHRQDNFTAVMIVPTGIGCEIGGHAGDAGPAAMLLGSCCDNLILHPNVVNGSDINEMPSNALYVEGSILTQLLLGQIGLRRVRSNKVMVLIEDVGDDEITAWAMNAVNAAVATWGLDVHSIRKLENPLNLQSIAYDGYMSGSAENLPNLHMKESGVDAVAVSTPVHLPSRNVAKDYYQNPDQLNPWGGAEAALTHALTSLWDVPVAHAPMLHDMDMANERHGVVDPRLAAEMVSLTYLNSVLKGLARAPRIVRRELAGVFPSSDCISAEDVDCVVVPKGVMGLPVVSAALQGIPVIEVMGNTSRSDFDLEEIPKIKLYRVSSYPEAAGLMQAMRSGITPRTLYRPLMEE